MTCLNYWQVHLGTGRWRMKIIVHTLKDIQIHNPNSHAWQIGCQETVSSIEAASQEWQERREARRRSRVCCVRPPLVRPLATPGCQSCLSWNTLKYKYNTHTHTSTHAQTHTNTQNYTNTQTHAHTHTHTHTHTQLRAPQMRTLKTHSSSIKDPHQNNIYRHLHVVYVWSLGKFP